MNPSLLQALSSLPHLPVLGPRLDYLVEVVPSGPGPEIGCHGATMDACGGRFGPLSAMVVVVRTPTDELMRASGFLLWHFGRN
jgi:hypothetical protein